MEWEYPSLAREFDRNNYSMDMKETVGGLEDLIMSVNVNLNLNGVSEL
jgi:hypothetical protein